MTAEAYRQAFEHYQAGDFQAAEQCCRQILQAHPAHADAQLLLGVIARKTGRLESALEVLNRAIEAQPQNGVSHGNRGMVYQQLGKLTEAVASYQQALRLAASLSRDPEQSGVCL